MGDTSTSSGTTAEPRGVGLSDPTQSANRRKILEVIDRMRATGVGADMDLPMIAVIGSQSAGKSSLIESISGITLPRAAGTCTRCPTECRLSYSDRPWSCKVVLRKTVDKRGQQMGIAENITFGSVITDKSHVEERIRRAQRAILNPSTSHETFLSGPDRDPDAKTELSFSKNCVCLELSGPDLTDLSFCDLPGLIASVGQGGNESDIQLVRDLVTTYISRPSCLILLTVTCETDFENQGAHHMAKQYDPDGQRTIGVLTKPDRIPAGEEDHWLRFIRNEAEYLTNGWFAVKQPSTKDLKKGVTWEGAREGERLFFSSTSPWSSETDYRHRFGTHNLTESLSEILSDLIKRRLPELAVELQNLLKETESQIRKLPAAPSDDAQGEIIMLVSGFARELAGYVEGTPDDNGIHQAIRPLNKTFLARIRDTAPKFCPFVSGSSQRYTHPEFLPSDGPEPDSDDETPRAPRPAVHRPQVRSIYNQPVFEPAHRPQVESNYKPVSISADDDDAICVDKVMEMGNKARARELPDHSLYIVTKRLIKISTERWDPPSHDLLEKVYGILVKEVNKMVDDRFHRFQYGGLYQRVKAIVNEVLIECRDSASQKIDWLLVMENKAPFTLNEQYFTACKEKFLKSYRKARDSQPREICVANHNPQDPYDPALHYMASARAYFQVTFSRFTDMVPMAIDQELLRGLDWDRGLHSTLTKRLEITGAGSLDKAKEYLQEPLDVVSRRESLQKKRERLQFAKRELQSMGIGPVQLSSSSGRGFPHPIENPSTPVYPEAEEITDDDADFAIFD